MKIAFATTLSNRGSTIIGRVMPLATELAHENDVHLLVLSGGEQTATKAVTEHIVGREPFTRTERGKQRLSGLALVGNMLATAWRTFLSLQRLKPDVVIIVKPLPSNTLGVWLWHMFRRIHQIRDTKYQILLDTDDFELTANQLSSLTQRAAIHWTERAAAKISSAIVAATPFLKDHFEQLTNRHRPVHLIPTGLSLLLPTDPPAPVVPTIAYFGSVSISSGHQTDLLPEILELVRQTHSDTQLLIAGDGDDVAKLKEEFTQRGLHNAVTWHGRFTLSEVKGLLAQTTLLIDPIDASIAQRAKSSFRVALATLAGLPVVTSNVGIRPYLIPTALHDRSFAQPADPADYARKITKFLDQPLTGAEQSAVQEHATQYTWENLSEKYSRIIKGIV